MGQEKGYHVKVKPQVQARQALAERRPLIAAALLREDLHGLPPDWTDCGSSCQLKILLLLLASITTVRMRWELVGAGASPRNRASPRTTTEPFLGRGGGGEKMGSSPPLRAALEPHHPHINTPPTERSQGVLSGASNSWNQGPFGTAQPS